MTRSLDLARLIEDMDFPSIVFLVAHPGSGRYGCYCHQGVYGVACFSSEKNAGTFAQRFADEGMSIERFTFDEARVIAKERPLPVVSLMLMDDPENPRIHFVR